jgi:Tat protein translocase TatB subunit
MSILGLGTQEMVIILVVALVVFGPNRLPEIAGKIGKGIRDLRQMSADLTGEFERTAGVQELKQAVQGELAGVKSQVTAVTDSVKRDLHTATSTGPTTVATTGTISSAKPATSGISATASVSPSTAQAAPLTKASKKDPLADVSFLEEIVAPPAAARPMVAPAATIPASRPPVAPVMVSADQVDALSRARQRRVEAGYNRRATS